MTEAKIKVALIHAVDIAIAPIKSAFQNDWPEAEVVHLWDETLSIERAKEASLTPFLFERVASLYELAKNSGVDAVMFTCSAFGEAIEVIAKDADIPVLKPNQAMFDEALTMGKPVTLLGSFEPAMAGMAQEFFDAALVANNQAHDQANNPAGYPTELHQVCVPEARSALQQNDIEGHNQLMLQAAQSQVQVDVIMLAHFSSSVAKSLLETETRKTVLSSPECAVRYLKRTLTS
ncbi:arylsulfatase [Photobacterium rosenbergii]|uniref:Arylsulfatase n=1 Tax=Photobacterium rosenbergii TaxID=294936 RepID=A0A2T3N6I1_9GAMM|nr:arylsulfatase [Photobacterium rosenbergii]PSW08308.1 arylsulfatase [Photobacterium rosenbergii]